MSDDWELFETNVPAQTAADFEVGERIKKINEQANVSGRHAGAPFYGICELTAAEARALGIKLKAGSSNEGLKYDGDKPPLHLLPPDALYAITEILDFGAKKYAPRNWEKGMDWSRLYRATLGHLFQWFMRKGADPETGKSHLWHAGCCILFLIAYEIRGVGQDDRPQTGA